MIKSKTGFTLLELLIVIAVASILVSIATASYLTVQKKARDAKRMGDMKSIASAAEQYYADSSGNYPADKDSFEYTLPDSTVHKYLPGGFPAEIKPTQNGYIYVSPYPTETSGFCACANLETQTGNSTGLNCEGYGTTSVGQYYCLRNLQ